MPTRLNDVPALQRAADAYARISQGRVMRYLKLTVPILLLIVLGYFVTRIGWSRVWRARPDAPGFYLILVVSFFVQPITDLIVYRRLWGVGRALRLRALVRKQALNSLIFDYSGEVYFYLWAHRNLGLQRKNLLHAIKDCNILSAVAGLTMAATMLAALIAAGALSLTQIVSGNMWALMATGLLPIAVGLGIFIGGKRMTTLSRRQMASTFGIFVLRSSAFLLLGIAAWWYSGVLPSFVACVEFVALRTVVNRLPLVINKDLIFVGVAIATASLMKFAVAGVTAVLVLMAGIDQVLAFALVGIPWVLEHVQLLRSPDPDASRASAIAPPAVGSNPAAKRLSSGVE